MIDIDTVIQNIEDKIHLLEKLKFDDDPKNYLYTPIKAVTITSSTDFKQLECQKFVRCTQSNKLVPLEKYSDSVVELKDENSENFDNIQGTESKIPSTAVGQVSVQHKRNYRRNSIANFRQKVLGDQKSSSVDKKRRNSTKFDSQKSSEVSSLKNPLENGQEKPKIRLENSQKNTKQITSITATTSSPLVNPRASLTSQPSKTTPLTKLDQQHAQIRTNQIQTTTKHPIGSPKFSRSYTEFLNNLNKDMKMFKEQQKRNEPCDNFLGKDAKIFVEDPISKLVGNVKEPKITAEISSDNKLDAVKIAEKEKVAEKSTAKNVEAVKESKPVDSKPEPKTTTANSTNMTEASKPNIIKFPASLLKAPISGMKNLEKAPIPESEPSKNIFDKIIKIAPEDAPKFETKSLNKIVMRRMTIDSAYDHRSLLKMKFDVTPDAPSPKIQKIQPQKLNVPKNNQSILAKSPEKLQKSDSKMPTVNQSLIHQKIIRLSPQKPQTSNIIDPKPNKMIKPSQVVLQSLFALKHKIPRRNSIGYGVKIETTGDIKRLKLSRDVKKSLADLEELKKVQESSNVEKRDQKIGNSKIKKDAVKFDLKNEGFVNPNQNVSTATIDYEDELESISACHIDKLAPKGDQTGNDVKDSVAVDHKSIKKVAKNLKSMKLKVKKRTRKLKCNESEHSVNDKLSEPKIAKTLDTDSEQIKKRVQKLNKHPNGNEKSIKRIQGKDVEKQLTKVDPKNNNLEQVEQEENNLEQITHSEVNSELKEVKIDKFGKQEDDGIKTTDVVTTKTMDIIRDIEIYKNLIRQQSSDSQNSNKSVENDTKIDKTVIKKLSVDKVKLKIFSNPQKFKKFKIIKEQVKAQPDSQGMKIQQDPGSTQQKPYQIQQKIEPQLQSINSQPQTTNSSSQKSIQSSQSSQKSKPDAPTMFESPQSSNPSTPINSNSPQLSNQVNPVSSQSSDSQNTSNSENLGKRRRQINPKYSESEYMLKNTSREFTNAIRSKMMINKPQKASNRKQSTKPEDQNAEKLEVTIDNCETTKPEDVPSTSKQSEIQQEPQIPSASQEIKCKICDKAFVKPKGLARHMPLHSGDRRFGCSKCDYRFTQRSDLMRHMLIHEGSPNIPCSKCNKKFRTSKNLQAHLQTHEASLPYKCNQCEVRFRSSKNLKYHLMSHHGGVNFQCGYCGNKFSDEKSLRTHVMEHENEIEDLDDEELEDYLNFMDDEEEEELLDSDAEPMVIAE
ncbi:unnamed protein product [Chironomus riparius]|uniref:C2H2-type domain-containing protein n=1 Tax=Chironomus riparius TaxID=315576 RepID=A0A9N9SAG1_9DIPT|nr:unnamed protein product [Chironomus riparius]